MSGALRCFALSTIFVGLLLCCPKADAGVGNFCIGGPCSVVHPIYVNVYWDSSATMWDSDVGLAASGMTESQIDAFTAALVHSTYFSQLGQYGVLSVSALPSITATACGPPPADVDTAISQMGTFIACVMSMNPAIVGNNQIVLNVFLPPQTMNTGFCNVDSSGAHATAMHDTGLSGQPIFTFNPTTSACNSSSRLLLVGLSHEMVEAATDPVPASPSGWKEPGGREIGDFCEDSTTAPFTPFVFAAVTQYWSNSANSCVMGFANATAPSVTSSTVCGTGQDMRLTLNGAFGPAPWDMPVNQVALRTLYVRGRITGTTGWGAGNFEGSPPDTVNFGRISWVPGAGPGGSDQIKIFGFDAGYGFMPPPAISHFVRPGNTLTITIENPANGVRATATFTAPVATQLNTISVPTNLNVNDVFFINGIVVDSGQCAVEGASVTMATSGGTFATSPVFTDRLGSFSSKFTAPAVGGTVQVGISAPVASSSAVNIHPRLASLVQPRGAVVGGQPTVLQGAGFDSSTSVTFGANAGTVQSVAPSHATVNISTPASNLPGGVGNVIVGATVHGIAGSSLVYDYITPGIPVFNFLGGSRGVFGKRPLQCGFGKFTVTLFNPDGSLQAGKILLTANYPAFQVSVFHRPLLSSITVASGSTVIIAGGGPITASNPGVPNSSATQSFPVMSPELCADLAAFQAQLGEIVAGKISPIRRFKAPCAGDCEAVQEKVIFWGDAENLSDVRNLVAIEGSDAGTIAAKYDVTAVSAEAKLKLMAENRFVLLSPKLGNSVFFDGPMMQIRNTEKVEDKEKEPTDSRIPEKCRISFSLPASASPAAVFSIMRLRSVGGSPAWIADSPSITDRRMHTVRTTADSTGTYALLRIVSEANRQHQPVRKAVHFTNRKQ